MSNTTDIRTDFQSTKTHPLCPFSNCMICRTPCIYISISMSKFSQSILKPIIFWNSWLQFFFGAPVTGYAPNSKPYLGWGAWQLFSLVGLWPGQQPNQTQPNPSGSTRFPPSPDNKFTKFPRLEEEANDRPVNFQPPSTTADPSY